MTSQTAGVHKDLSGFTVGITADRRSDEQINMLVRRGATCVHAQALETHPFLLESEIGHATKQLITEPPDITVLTTGIGVPGWFSSADTQQSSEALRRSINGSEIYARGAKALGAAITSGLDVSLRPAVTLDEIIDQLAVRGVEGLTIALQLDGDPNTPVIERIKSLGARVIAVPVYRWTQPTNQTKLVQLVTAVARNEVDAVTFTARPAVENFVQCAEQEGLYSEIYEATRQTALVVCVGERTALTASESGLGNPTFPDRPLLGTMVRHLGERLGKSVTEVYLAGHHVVLRGRELRVGLGDPQLLTPREKQLLSILLSRPGIVFSKGKLLSEVWQGNSSDQHVVEVTVGRLRKRLGIASEGLETVVRRGYRVSAP